MKRKALISAVFFLVFVLVLVGGLSGALASEKTIKVGALMAVTGWWASAYDTTILNMTKIGVEMINEQGGISVKGKKYKIELIVEDTKSDFNGVASAANKLIYDRGVKFIVGPSGYFVSAATPVTEPAKVMTLVGWHINMPGEVDATTPHTFATSHGSTTKDIAAIKSMRRDFPEMKNIALVVPDDGAIPYQIPIVRKLLAENEFTVVGDLIKFPNELEDFSPIVAKILSLKGIEAVFVEKCAPPHLGSIMKGLRDAGNRMPVFTGSPVSTAVVAAIAGPRAAEGVRATIETRNDPEMPHLMAEMAERYTKLYGTDTPLSYQCVTGIYLLKTLMEVAQSIDPKDVMATLESMDKVDTIAGQAFICGEKTFGIKHLVAHPLGVQKFEDGRPQSAGWIDIGFVP